MQVLPRRLLPPEMVVDFTLVEPETQQLPVELLTQT